MLSVVLLLFLCQIRPGLGMIDEEIISKLLGLSTYQRNLTLHNQSSKHLQGHKSNSIGLVGFVCVLHPSNDQSGGHNGGHAKGDPYPERRGEGFDQVEVARDLLGLGRDQVEASGVPVVAELCDGRSRKRYGHVADAHLGGSICNLCVHINPVSYKKCLF